jgi:glycine C-acetyltransferase
VVDDSHGVGAFGATGRGTEEYTEAPLADLLVATLGKAFGVNGGYVVADDTIIRYLRETAPLYIYSNPITPAEAAAALKAIDAVDSPSGVALLRHLRLMIARFKAGLIRLGFETLPGEHPVVPLLLRDTARTTALVAHLRRNYILATGLTYPWCRRAMRKSASRSTPIIRRMTSIRHSMRSGTFSTNDAAVTSLKQILSET